MGRHSYHRKDENEKEIVEKLRAIGASVLHLDSGTDILVGYKGMNFLFEIKPTRKYKLTPREEKFVFGWRGHLEIVHTFEFILASMQQKLIK